MRKAKTPWASHADLAFLAHYRVMPDMAEAVRFELTDSFPSPVFKTGAIDHSATLPQGVRAG